MNAVSVSSMVAVGARGVELGCAQLKNRPNLCGVGVVQKQHRQRTRSRAKSHVHVPDDPVLQDSGAALFPSSVTLMSAEIFVSHDAFLLVAEGAEDTSHPNFCQNRQNLKPLNCLTFCTMEG